MVRSEEQRKRVASFWKTHPIDEIVINRRDRIGDAVVSLPLLLALRKNKTIKRHHTKITILTSLYNDFVFKPFRFHTIPKEVKFTYDFTLTKELEDTIENIILSLRKRNNGMKNKVLLDFTIDKNTALAYSPTHYIVHPNLLFLNLGISDIFVKEKVGVPNCPHVLKIWIRMVEEALGIDIYDDVDEEPDEIRKAITRHDTLWKQLDIDKRHYAFVFVGGPPYRNIHVDKWDDIIRRISQHMPVVVYDNPDQLNSHALQKRGLDNVIFLDGSHDLWSMAYISSHSLLYVGLDTGPSHLFQYFTNAAIIFTTGNHSEWRPFIKNKYHRLPWKSNTVIEMGTTHKGNKKFVVYTPCYLRPCFNIRCGWDICKRIDTRFIERVIDEI